MSDLRAVLVAIQELHTWNRLGFCKTCKAFNCPTRRLVDGALKPQRRPSGQSQCPECKGSGELIYAREIMPGRDFYTKPCHACAGTGYAARTTKNGDNK